MAFKVLASPVLIHTHYTQAIRMGDSANHRSVIDTATASNGPQQQGKDVMGSHHNIRT